jgi:hypothetical protein
MAEPQYVLEVEPLELGADVKAVGLELVDIEEREPVRGPEAARMWAAALGALAGNEPWALDFFSHLDRVREYCRNRSIAFEEKASGHALIVPALSGTALAELLERFAGETFGARAGSLAASGDQAVEGELARHGVDAYRAAFRNYLFCAVCDFENGFLTLITEKLWASEVLRRVKPAAAGLPVEVSRPQ